MAVAPKAIHAATASLDPRGQTVDHINALMKKMLGMAGCDHCGRLAFLRVDFLSDPPPDLAAGHVISFRTE